MKWIKRSIEAWIIGLVETSVKKKTNLLEMERRLDSMESQNRTYHNIVGIQNNFINEAIPKIRSEVEINSLAIQGISDKIDELINEVRESKASLTEVRQNLRNIEKTVNGLVLDTDYGNEKLNVALESISADLNHIAKKNFGSTSELNKIGRRDSNYYRQ